MKLRAVVMLIFLGTSIATAQQGLVPVSVKVLEERDLSVRGRQAVVAIAAFPLSSDTGWHTHPGEMVGYMLEGAVVIRQDGTPPVTVQAGESFIIPAGVAHSCANAGGTQARMFVTYFVEKDKPLRTNVAAR